MFESGIERKGEQIIWNVRDRTTCERDLGERESESEREGERERGREVGRKREREGGREGEKGILNECLSCL